MVLSEYKKGDEVEILKLFRVAFKKDLSLQYWNWRFKDNPMPNSPMIDLMWDADNLAGHYSVSPIEILVFGKKYPAALSGTTMTNPEYQGKGIFTELSLSLYNRINNKYHTSAVLGFPNKNSHYGLVKKINWKEIYIIPNFSLPLRKLDGEHKTVLRRITNFEYEHETFINNAINSLGFSVMVNRSVSYLNWRYTLNPVNDYYCFEHVLDNRIVAISVVKKFSGLNNSELDLVEFFCAAEGQQIKDLILSIKDFFESMGFYSDKINTWISLYDTRFLYMEVLGFEPGLPLTYACVKILNNEIETINDPRNWYISMGDSDVF